VSFECCRPRDTLPAQEQTMASQAEQYDPYAIPTRRMTREDLLRAASHWGIDATGMEIEALRARVK
jgi:hypothetical protein